MWQFEKHNNVYSHWDTQNTPRCTERSCVWGKNSIMARVFLGITGFFLPWKKANLLPLTSQLCLFFHSKEQWGWLKCILDLLYLDFSKRASQKRNCSKMHLGDICLEMSPHFHVCPSLNKTSGCLLNHPSSWDVWFILHSLSVCLASKFSCNFPTRNFSSLCTHFYEWHLFCSSISETLRTSVIFDHATLIIDIIGSNDYINPN